jgi:hypothetical protein
MFPKETYTLAGFEPRSSRSLGGCEEPLSMINVRITILGDYPQFSAQMAFSLNDCYDIYLFLHK